MKVCGDDISFDNRRTEWLGKFYKIIKGSNKNIGLCHQVIQIMIVSLRSSLLHKNHIDIFGLDISTTNYFVAMR
jgi:hypothetical protein